jgi:hypothetical protein
MAMIAWKQDQKEESRRLLEEAKGPIEEIFLTKKFDVGAVGRFWFDWVNAWLLYREAVSLIEE